MRRYIASALVLGCNAGGSTPPTSSAPVSGPASYGTQAARDYEGITYPSGDLTLFANLFAPPGNGPFPAIVWNHGSQEEPGVGAMAVQWYVDNGFVVLYPHRRGHGRSASQGTYIGELIDDAHPEDGRWVEAMVEQSNDVIAGAAYLATLPYVDARRVATVGCSFGGIEALFAAEKGTGIVSAIDFAGASHMWSRIPPLRERMKLAARNAKVPVFFLQAENDADTTPTKVLSDEMRRAHKNVRARVFPPYGTTLEDGHGGFCVGGDNPPWAPDVLAFLTETMQIGR